MKCSYLIHSDALFGHRTIEKRSEMGEEQKDGVMQTDQQNNTLGGIEK